MAEINNNFPNFGIKKIDKTEKPEPAENLTVQENTKEEQPTFAPVPDSYGKVHVKHAKGGNITKSVDEAVKLMKENPAICGCSEGIFDNAYNAAIARGKTTDEAYMEALMFEEAMLEICPHN